MNTHEDKDEALIQTRKPQTTDSAALGSAGLGRNVIALGWVAFFGGLAQDMILPVLPVFYTAVLGLRKEFIGLIEGALTTVVSLAKIGAGYLSDALGRRKTIVFLGYGLSAMGRFGLGFAGSGGAVLGLRLSDGLGKGLKDAPRDALVAGSAGDRTLGFAFGVQRTLDTLGSALGPVLRRRNCRSDTATSRSCGIPRLPWTVPFSGMRKRPRSAPSHEETSCHGEPVIAPHTLPLRRGQLAGGAPGVVTMMRRVP